ncbi:hypothetical protein K438DRAFT_1766321 [Mycena galopus ATCC 62051]|nr:hypothetical protein K438DRAFT_1766321 [Mycena galopus ATCC 62051]
MPVAPPTAGNMYTPTPHTTYTTPPASQANTNPPLVANTADFTSPMMTYALNAYTGDDDYDLADKVEEFIDEESDGFVKFVHNGNANPLLDRDDPFYSITEFLSLKNMKIAEGKDVFGGGNVGSVFKKSPHQHSCNAYCSWFNLPVMNRSKRD